MFSESTIIEKLTGEKSSYNLYPEDDCSVTKYDSKNYLITSKDLLIEGTHFLKSYPLELVAQKAITANVSDIFAMNGSPQKIHLGLGVPSWFQAEQFKVFHQGLKKSLKKFNIELVGGDTCLSKKGLLISITIQGIVPQEKLRVRKKTRRGELILLTGFAGDSKAGLEIIQKSHNYKSHLARRHLCPQINQAPTNLMSSLMDCSDGVIQDIEKLIPSQVGFRIHADRLPISKALKDYAKSKAWKYALTGGEDYGLLMTCSAENETTIVKKFKEKHIKITQIGEVTKKDRKIYLHQNELKKTPASFQHF